MTKVFLMVLFCFNAFADEAGIVGRWKTIDDKTDKPKSIVEISKDGETFKGKIVEILNPEKVDAVCDKCPGDKKDTPIKGLELMWGFTKDDDEWSGGSIIDPENGKTYKCRLQLEDGGKKLDVRGYIGFSLLGRSQTWIRE
jgi:uncharacterized protein (DUF2147 family)